MDVTLSFSFFTFCCGSPTRTSRLIGIFFPGSNSPKPLPPFMATFGILLVSSSDLLSSDLTCKALPFLPARHLMPSVPAPPTAKDEATGKQERIKKRSLSIVAAPQRYCMFPLLLNETEDEQSDMMPTASISSGSVFSSFSRLGAGDGRLAAVLCSARAHSSSLDQSVWPSPSACATSAPTRPGRIWAQPPRTTAILA